MPQRNCTKAKTEATKSSKRICIPISREEYAEMMEDAQRFRTKLDGLIDTYPELFPAEIEQGYQLYGLTRQSAKMPEVSIRRICLVTPDEQGRLPVYRIVPGFVMPYMVGYTDDVEKALFLRRFGVPFWALTYVFGRDDMYWQRMMARLGQNDLVGTTIKDPEKLPEHLLADEKHTRLNGEKAYIATTVADDCVLGASLTLAADEEHLTEAYGHFKQEARRLDPDYQPQTVNTDGWSPTQLAWRALFPAITIILCFLHAFLSIRSRGKHLKETFHSIKQRVWDIYHADHREDFWQHITDLKSWAQEHVTGPTLEAILKLCSKADRFALAFDHPDAYRTSNMLDRALDPLDRCLYSARYFHGHLMSAEYQIRAWALFHTFQPYCPRAKIRQSYQSPFHKLNGFVYHDNWLQNLLVASSLGGHHAPYSIR
jgi:hypothetical protein